ncbi:hypothetical protein [Ruminiclostridium cellobioparum]|uniref:hypothetical protein n=1 Tax=Ruminiclostridium cellobioparum TaxID=29355 RepID=UPI0028B16A65|nr:hypothetical protein [Ruminiclostridium cellobioparum]
MTNLSVFIVILLIAIIIAGKYANKTIMNAVRIGAFILALMSLIVHWDTTTKILENLFSHFIPFVWKQLCAFVSWLISNSYDISGKALKKLLK